MQKWNFERKPLTDCNFDVKNEQLIVRFPCDATKF